MVKGIAVPRSIYYWHNRFLLGELNNKKSSSDADLLNNHTKDIHGDQLDVTMTPASQRRAVIDSMTHLPMIEIKEIACYLSLLEGGDVKDKLECKIGVVTAIIILVKGCICIWLYTLWVTGKKKLSAKSYPSYPIYVQATLD